MYINPMYGLFNQGIVQNEYIRQQHHNSQMQKSFECARKLEEFLKSMDEVEPEYQQIAFEKCCFVKGKHMIEHR